MTENSKMYAQTKKSLQQILQNTQKVVRPSKANNYSTIERGPKLSQQKSIITQKTLDTSFDQQQHENLHISERETQKIDILQQKKSPQNSFIASNRINLFSPAISFISPKAPSSGKSTRLMTPLLDCSNNFLNITNQNQNFVNNSMQIANASQFVSPKHIPSSSVNNSGCMNKKDQSQMPKNYFERIKRYNSLQKQQKFKSYCSKANLVNNEGFKSRELVASKSSSNLKSSFSQLSQQSIQQQSHFSSQENQSMLENRNFRRKSSDKQINKTQVSSKKKKKFVQHIYVDISNIKDQKEQQFNTNYQSQPNQNTLTFSNQSLKDLVNSSFHAQNNQNSKNKPSRDSYIQLTQEQEENEPVKIINTYYSNQNAQNFSKTNQNRTQNQNLHIEQLGNQKGKNEHINQNQVRNSLENKPEEVADEIEPNFKQQTATFASGQEFLQRNDSKPNIPLLDLKKSLQKSNSFAASQNNNINGNKHMKEKFNQCVKEQINVSSSSYSLDGSEISDLYSPSLQENNNISQTQNSFQIFRNANQKSDQLSQDKAHSTYFGFQQNQQSDVSKLDFQQELEYNISQDMKESIQLQFQQPYLQNKTYNTNEHKNYIIQQKLQDDIDQDKGYKISFSNTFEKQGEQNKQINQYRKSGDKLNVENIKTEQNPLLTQNQTFTLNTLQNLNEYNGTNNLQINNINNNNNNHNNNNNESINKKLHEISASLNKSINSEEQKNLGSELFKQKKQRVDLEHHLKLLQNRVIKLSREENSLQKKVYYITKKAININTIKQKLKSDIQQSKENFENSQIFIKEHKNKVFSDIRELQNSISKSQYRKLQEKQEQAKNVKYSSIVNRSILEDYKQQEQQKNMEKKNIIKMNQRKLEQQKLIKEEIKKQIEQYNYSSKIKAEQAQQDQIEETIKQLEIIETDLLKRLQRTYEHNRELLENTQFSFKI